MSAVAQRRLEFPIRKCSSSGRPTAGGDICDKRKPSLTKRQLFDQCERMAMKSDGGLLVVAGPRQLCTAELSPKHCSSNPCTPVKSAATSCKKVLVTNGEPCLGMRMNQLEVAGTIPLSPSTFDDKSCTTLRNIQSVESKGERLEFSIRKCRSSGRLAARGDICDKLKPSLTKRQLFLQCERLPTESDKGVLVADPRQLDTAEVSLNHCLSNPCTPVKSAITLCKKMLVENGEPCLGRRRDQLQAADTIALSTSDDKRSTTQRRIQAVESKGERLEVARDLLQPAQSISSPLSPSKRNICGHIIASQESRKTPTKTPAKSCKENAPEPGSATCQSLASDQLTQELINNCTPDRKAPTVPGSAARAGSHIIAPRESYKIPAKTPTKSCKENAPVPGSATCQSMASDQLAQELITNCTPDRKAPTVPGSVARSAKGGNELYQRAKRALHTAQPNTVVCRDKELSAIAAFLSAHLNDGTAGSMYISGAPGTGKTALLRQVLDRCELHCHKVFINCMTVKSAAQLYEKIGEELRAVTGGVATSKNVAVTPRHLEKTFASGGRPVVLILDEIDQLHSRNQEVLYTVFEWPALTDSKLVLIGVANALDLTDRLLPRLHSRPNFKPVLLNFAPYNKEQIQGIIASRLSELNASNALDAMAIQFCARKVAAVAGDIRKALDICRRSIELAEGEQAKLSISSASPALWDAVPTPKSCAVGLQQVAKVLSAAQSGGCGTSESSLPLQQKLAACSLLLLLKHGKFKEVTFGKLHDTYVKVCHRREVAPMEQCEFVNMCSLLESLGIMSLKKVKDDLRMCKVTLKLDEAELEHSLQDKLLITSVLSEGLP